MSLENRNKSENISTVRILGTLVVCLGLPLAFNHVVGSKKVDDCAKQGLETRVIPAKNFGRTVQPPVYYCAPKAELNPVNQSNPKQETIKQPKSQERITKN